MLTGGRVAALGASLALAACATAPQSLGGTSRAKAYVVAEIEVKDLGAYRRYAAAAFPIIRKFAGKFLARGGATVAIEGRAPAGRVMIIEFPSLAQAKAFEYSPDYAAIAPLRRSSADSRLFIVEGTANAAASLP